MLPIFVKKNLIDMRIKEKWLSLFFTFCLVLIAKSQSAEKLNPKHLPKTMLVYDDFIKKTENWSKIDHEEAYSEVKNGKLVFKNRMKNDNNYQRYNSFGINPFKTYYIETSFTLKEGPDNYGNGLVFNRTTTNKGNSYVFGISENKYFTVWRYLNGEFETQHPWTTTELIKPGKSNKLGILSRRGEISFYINDFLVHKMPRPPYMGADIGFSVNKQTTIYIDYFLIRQNPDGFEEIENASDEFEYKKLESDINTVHSNHSAVISTDGNLLFFTRTEHSGAVDVQRNELLFSTYNENQKKWSQAQLLPKQINQGTTPQICHVSADKKTLIVNATYDKKGKYLSDHGLSYFRMHNGEWSHPKPIVIENFKNYDVYESYSISDNGKIMILSAHATKSHGERDLYVSFNIGENKWSKPKNLGKTINTYSDDYSPCLAPDNVTLYYSTYGKSGYGKSDIYMTRRLDNTWQNWSKPLNLGPSINSKNADDGFKVDAHGYYAYLDRTNEELDNEINKIILPPSARPGKVLLVKGVVMDKKTASPIEADISYINLENGYEEGNVHSSIDGSFILVVPYGAEYAIVAHADGYLAESHVIRLLTYKDSTTKSYKEVEINLELAPMEKGQVLSLNSLFFAAAQYEILPQSYIELDRLYDILNSNLSLTIEVMGHTDQAKKETSDQYLIDLSLNRALAVKDYLVQHGISPNRIICTGHGRSNPISTIQAENRRVEIKITRF